MDPGRRGLRGGDDRPARPAPAPVREDRGPAARDRAPDRHPGRGAWTPGENDALGRPTIARALMAAGFATSVEDAFARLIGHGAPGYVRREGLGPEDAIRTIRAAGGVPVLAHFREAPGRLGLLRELIDVGLAGLEVYYRSFDAGTVIARRGRGGPARTPADGWHGLPRRPRVVRGVACGPVGAARGRGDAPRDDREAGPRAGRRPSRGRSRPPP